MANEEILQRIRENNARGEEIIKVIQKELPLLQTIASKLKQDQLTKELKEQNIQLKKELEFWANRVNELETQLGIKQYPLPILSMAGNVPVANEPTTAAANPKDNARQSAPKKGSSESKNESAAPKKEKAPKPAKQEKQPAEESKDVNVSRLDLRVGRILSAKKHPDAESLYVEEIEVGEEKPRTVVSGLVKFVPLEEMQNRMVVVLCNLKPAKMRGITSEAMVMCASTPEKVEILAPPPDSAPGDRVVCDQYPGEPDALLNPKKKIFEQVAPDLKTDGNCYATYKSAPLKVADKGVIRSLTLTNVQIK